MKGNWLPESGPTFENGCFERTDSPGLLSYFSQKPDRVGLGISNLGMKQGSSQQTTWLFN